MICAISIRQSLDQHFFSASFENFLGLSIIGVIITLIMVCSLGLVPISPTRHMMLPIWFCVISAVIVTMQWLRQTHVEAIAFTSALLYFLLSSTSSTFLNERRHSLTEIVFNIKTACEHCDLVFFEKNSRELHLSSVLISDYRLRPFDELCSGDLNFDSAFFYSNNYNYDQLTKSCLTHNLNVKTLVAFESEVQIGLSENVYNGDNNYFLYLITQEK